MQYYDATKSLVCIHKNESGEPHGEIYNRYLEKPIIFTGFISLINKMDAFLDQIGFPQAFNEYRTFVRKNKERKFLLREAKSYMNETLFETKIGNKATFIIQVQFRQNSSWQGTITWAEGKKTQHYRSILEMIKLMDSALTPENEEEAPIQATEKN